MSNALQKQVEIAQIELDELLTSGKDTFTARKLLKQAQLNLAEDEQKENKKRFVTDSKKKATRQREASEMIETVVDELNTNLGNLVHIDIPILNIPVQFAENILSAHDMLTNAQEGKQTYNSKISELRNRQNELEEKRNKIIQQRTAGQCDDEEDSKSLALIQADLEGLSQLIDKTINGTQAVNTSAEENAISEAQAALTHAINTAYIAGLSSLASQFEASLIETAQLLTAAPGVLVKDRYQPRIEIKKAVQIGVI